MTEDLTFTDRYGGNLPDPEAVCKGPCEAMGIYPVTERDDTLTPYERRQIAMKKAGRGASEDGATYFIPCPDCAGTGRRYESDALRDIAAERTRQVYGEGHTAENDDEYLPGVLVDAAIGYARFATKRDDQREDHIERCITPQDWPWTGGFKPTTRRQDLVKAAALIAAEIDKLDRAAQKEEDR